MRGLLRKKSLNIKSEYYLECDCEIINLFDMA